MRCGHIHDEFIQFRINELKKKTSKNIAVALYLQNID